MLSTDELAELVQAPVTAVTDLGRSHEWGLSRATLADGRDVFVKHAPDQAGVLTAEAKGLRWLTEASQLPAGVVASDDRNLVLPWLPEETPTAAAAEQFGRDLAAMHGHQADSYGAPWPGYIGPLPLDNASGELWPQWYAERRLLPYLRRSTEALGPRNVRLVEQVIDRIEELAGPPEPPSRIHGDLWAGNVLWSGGRAWLIDPAAHGGHRETDLAMLQLFGLPHLDAVLAAYTGTTPLADGWRHRVPFHQLHPLLVHTALFGTAYSAQTARAAQAALG